MPISTEVTALWEGQPATCRMLQRQSGADMGNKEDFLLG